MASSSKNEVDLKFRADTEQFDGAIKSSNATLKEMRSELKLQSEQLKGTGDSAEVLVSRQQTLRDALAANADKQQALNSKLQLAKTVYGEDSVEVAKLKTSLNYAKTEEESLRNQLSQTNAALSEHKSALSGASEKLSDISTGMEVAGAKASVFSAAVKEAGEKCLEAYDEVEEGAKNVVKATGATGDAADELSEVYEGVAYDIVGDLGDIGSAVGEVSTRFGYTGDALEATSEDFEKFSEVTGADAVNAVQEVSRVMNAWGMDASQYPQILDQVTKAAQDTGISADSLMSSLDKNGTSFRELGFDTTEAIAILAEFEKEGVDSTTALAGMKKAVANFAEDGKDAQTGFAELFQGIKDGTVSTADAMDVFGTKAGPALVEAIQSGRFEYEDFVDALEGSQGTVNATFDEVSEGSYQNELAMQRMKLALGDVGESVEASLTPVIEAATSGLEGMKGIWDGLPAPMQTAITTIGLVLAAIGPVVLVIGSVISAISTVMGVIAPIISAIGGVVAAINPVTLIIAAVIAAIVAVIAILVTLYNNCDEFRAFVDGMVAGILSVVQGFVDWFQNTAMPAIQAVIDAIGGFFSGLLSTVSTVIDGAAGVISQFGLNPFENFHIAIDAILSFFAGAFPQLEEPINAVRGFIDSVFSDPFGTLRDAVTSVVSWVYDNFHLEFPHINLPHFWVSGGEAPWGIGGQGSMPSFGVDWYASGGVLMSPTIFGINGRNVMAGGEAGPEAIAPISVLQSYVRSAVSDSFEIDYELLGSMVARAMSGVSINMDGKKVAQAVAKPLDSVMGTRSSMASRGIAYY